MKNLFSLLFIVPCTLWSQVDFQTWFTPNTLRVDYIMAGTHDGSEIFPLLMKKEPHWGGPQENLADTFRYGEFMLELEDAATGMLIYSRGFSTLFNEWQTTAESKLMRKAFYQVAVMPFPRSPVVFKLLRRNEKGVFVPLFMQEIDPDDYFIVDEAPVLSPYRKLIDAGDPAVCLDIAFVAEGYTGEEMELFQQDVERLSAYLLNTPPFDSHRHRINIWAVEAESQESGTDVPGERMYRNTSLSASDYTFGLSRYITTFDLKSLHDHAASVPYDQLIVLVNSERYGGGGMYNHYASVTSGHPLSPVVLVHEFGHSFAGLGDEYYDSEVAYEEFYRLDVEPWEPNITTLVDFGSKWENMLEPGTPVPTPAGSGGENKVGVYEGAGYMSRGIYRPAIDCRMKSNAAGGFCPVCRRAIECMILFYSK